jgi:sensor histidine kinase YesM
LIISYPIILIVLFSLARFIAGRFIKPISSIINTSNDITKDTHFAHSLPPQQDMNCLSQTINNLLDRIETGGTRKQLL